MATALNQRAADLSATLSSTFASAAAPTAAAPNAAAPNATAPERCIPSFGRSDAVVVVTFVYRLFLFVARTNNLITDFDGETTYEAVMSQLFALIEDRM